VFFLPFFVVFVPFVAFVFGRLVAATLR